MNRAKLTDVSSWVLTCCAVVVTVLVVRREFVDPARPRAAEMPQPVFVESWRESLEYGIRTGRADAPVQLVEFGDFQCPACARFEQTLDTIRQRYPEQVSLVFAHAPIDRHEFAVPAARAAECAHRQGRFEQMRTQLFAGQRSFGGTSWSEFAKSAGVPDLETFESCVNATEQMPRVTEGKKLAESFGAQATPTLLLNGWMLPAPPSVDELDRLVREVIAGKQPTFGKSDSFWSRWWSS